MDQKTFKLKIAFGVLATIKLVLFLLGFFMYLQLLGELLRYLGFGDTSGVIGWGITIGLAALAGWAYEAQKENSLQSS